jgi:hypothetical protein
LAFWPKTPRLKLIKQILDLTITRGIPKLTLKLQTNHRICLFSYYTSSPNSRTSALKEAMTISHKSIYQMTISQ